MGREEQIEEREVLDSIFPDEITDLSEEEFRIAIQLDLPPDPNGGGSSEDETEPPVMLLTVRYPEDYPDKAPHLDLSAPQSGAGSSGHPLFSVAEDKEQLLAGVEETIQENLGMAMVFTLVSALKDAAEQLVMGRQEAAAKVQEEALLAAEREENQKFHGTPVTRESFLKWRDAFVQEMAEKQKREEEERQAELAKRGGSKGGSGVGVGRDGQRLTGRQLWERGLAGKGDDDDEAAEEDDEDESGILKDVQKLKVTA